MAYMIGMYPGWHLFFSTPLVENIIVGVFTVIATPSAFAAMTAYGEDAARQEIALQRRYGVGDQTIREWREKGYIK